MKKVTFNLTTTKSDGVYNTTDPAVNSGTTETSTINTDSVEEIRNFLNRFDDVSDIDSECPSQYGFTDEGNLDLAMQKQCCDSDENTMDVEFDSREGTLQLARESEKMRHLISLSERDVKNEFREITISLKPYKNIDGDYMVGYYVNGELDKEKSYFTKDKDDALKHLNIIKREAGVFETKDDDIEESFDYRDEEVKDPNDYDQRDGSIMRYGKPGHSKKSNYEVNNQGDNSLPMPDENDKMFESNMLEEWKKFKNS